MEELPRERINPSSLFNFYEGDDPGPFSLKERKEHYCKVFISCSYSTKSVNELISDAFIKVFSRFFFEGDGTNFINKALFLGYRNHP